MDAGADVDAGAEAVDVADVVLTALVMDHDVDGVEVDEGRFCTLWCDGGRCRRRATW